MANGMRQILLMLIPAAAAILVLAEPMTRLVYQRGEFDAAQTEVVAEALFWFAFSLPFNGLFLICTRTFFSLQRPWVPSVVSGSTWRSPRSRRRAVRAPSGSAGIVAATVIATAASVVAYAVVMRGAAGIEFRRLLWSAIRITARRRCSPASATWSGLGLDDALGTSVPPRSSRSASPWRRRGGLLRHRHRGASPTAALPERASFPRRQPSLRLPYASTRETIAKSSSSHWDLARARLGAELETGPIWSGSAAVTRRCTTRSDLLTRTVGVRYSSPGRADPVRVPGRSAAALPSHGWRIRNFSIIAHIDHGKSTLADRILELTGAVDARKHVPQMLDSMDLERERGITIKAQAVRVAYRGGDGETYHLHLIDTPGHVDFSYEVSRSLAACEGALLVVDAAQGVEAQTVANAYAAVEAGLGADPGAQQGRPAERRAPSGSRPRSRTWSAATPDEVAADLGQDRGGGRPRCSRRSSTGSPPPEGEPEAPPRALIFDSEFDQYRGVVAYVRMVDGAFARASRITAMQAGTEAEIDEIGFFTPEMKPARRDERRRGRLRDHRDQGRDRAAGRRHADRPRAPASEALPGYREVTPMVFCGLFPIDTDRYEDLRDALDRLAPQRRRALIRARDLRGAGLRLPLRLPRPAAHGHRPRAASSASTTWSCWRPPRTSATRSS